MNATDDVPHALIKQRGEGPERRNARLEDVVAVGDYQGIALCQWESVTAPSVGKLVRKAPAHQLPELAGN
jgi:hypothetical protein